LNFVIQKINDVKVNFVICNDLNPFGTIHVENIPRFFYAVVLEPFLFSCELIKDKLKEQNLAAGATNQSCFINQEHLSKIFIKNVLVISFFFLFALLAQVVVARYLPNWHSKGLSLSIERVDLVVLRIIKTFHREVFRVGDNVNLQVFDNFSG
jgi:hypothetical protein